jgi:hypothetical protein
MSTVTMGRGQRAHRSDVSQRAVTQLLEAPSFDIDAPVAVQDAQDGVYLLVVPPLKPRDSIRMARRLARGGFADPAWAAAFVARVRTHGCRPTATVLRLTLPLNAEPGARPGHTNIYVQREMSFDDSCRFARALGCLVDSQQRAVSKLRHEWRVRSVATSTTQGQLSPSSA